MKFPFEIEYNITNESAGDACETGVWGTFLVLIY
jgi:hypothetical protein